VSDTQETDKQAVGVIGWYSCATVPADFARKLERERDEAREDAKRATYDAAQETIKVSTVKSHWIEACRERDIARESAERYRRKTLSQDANLAEAHRLLDAAKESLNAIHVEVGGWIAEMMKEGK
jgi:uncharacterized coiled-coil DUF342 family protein